MLPSFYRDTVTRIRPATTTSRGSTIPDWENATSLQIAGCHFQPGITTLSMDGRVLGISDGATCYMPANADVQAGDRIAFRGNVYTINGDIRQWPSASGGMDHIELHLMRWQG